ncbi:MAG: hypothetical protein J6Q61_02845 [Bacteroidales bacterium]|nr:hypothetical protein [Bacteroidales bacterium]MBO5853654.1 hypothetical protein [Bacteroidales bacterium]
MDVYTLALECKQEGRLKAPLLELVEKYRQDEEFELYLMEQEKDAKMFDELAKDLEKSGYCLDIRNRVLCFVENQVNCPSSQVNTEDEVFTCVDINADEVFDPENGVIRTKIYMEFETKDGRYFDVELTQENEAVKETDSGFLDGYYPGKRIFLDIELKN